MFSNVFIKYNDTYKLLACEPRLRWAQKWFKGTNERERIA